VEFIEIDHLINDLSITTLTVGQSRDMLPVRLLLLLLLPLVFSRQRVEVTTFRLVRPQCLALTRMLTLDDI